jgi:glycosyltransferase involved in cell wall biosynthesis
LEFVVKIAGTGELKYINELKSFISSNNLQNHVFFVGELSHSQTSELLQNAYISIVPSIIYENLPNSLLESFANSTPVIGSDLGSLSAVIKDDYNGLLFSPNDENNLTEKIKYCLDNPSTVLKMGENAKAMANNEFSPEMHVSKLTTLFEELLGSR